MGFPDRKIPMGLDMGHKRKRVKMTQGLGLQILLSKKTNSSVFFMRKQRKQWRAGMVSAYNGRYWWPWDSYQGHPSLPPAPLPRRHHVPSLSPSLLLPSSYTPRARTSSLKGCQAYPDSAFLFFSDIICPNLHSSSFQECPESWSGGSHEQTYRSWFWRCWFNFPSTFNSIEWVKHKFHGLRKCHRFFWTHLRNWFDRWHFSYTLTQTQKFIFALFTEGTSLNHCLVRNQLYWDINSFH